MRAPQKTNAHFVSRYYNQITNHSAHPMENNTNNTIHPISTVARQFALNVETLKRYHRKELISLTVIKQGSKTAYFITQEEIDKIPKIRKNLSPQSTTKPFTT